MTIDWFTTSAQIINFLILIWILKKLLFRPIINTMENRQQDLTRRLQQIESQKTEVQTLKAQYEKNLQQLQIDKDQILLQAKQQAKTEKDKLLLQLNEEIQQKKINFNEQLHKQQQQHGQLISQTIAEKSLGLSKKILTQLADQTLEQRIVEHFLQSFSELPEIELQPIKQALIQQGSATILTRFELNITTQQQIQNSLDNITPGIKLVFKQHDYLLCGIALETDGRSWEWNIDRYLSELETELIKSND